MGTTSFFASSGLLAASAIGLGAISQVASAVPQATTQVSKFCELRGGVSGFDQQLNVPLPVAQSTSCDLSNSVGLRSATAQGSAVAGFGPGIPQVGAASALVQITAFEAIAEANFMASVQFAFQITPIATAPVSVARIPVAFSAAASGYAERSGYGIGTALGSAHMSGNGLGSTEALFNYRVDVVDPIAYDEVDYEKKIGGFDVARTFDLYPESTYTVVLSTGCSSWAGPVGQGAAASIGCAAWVDPVLGFDQVAFNAAMGSTAFPLAEYYAFTFSDNLPIPEPETYVLLLAGLVLVARRVRWGPSCVRPQGDA